VLLRCCSAALLHYTVLLKAHSSLLTSSISFFEDAGFYITGSLENSEDTLFLQRPLDISINLKVRSCYGHNIKIFMEQKERSFGFGLLSKSFFLKIVSQFIYFQASSLLLPNYQRFVFGHCNIP
jgi:hypothetical protein